MPDFISKPLAYLAVFIVYSGIIIGIGYYKGCSQTEATYKAAQVIQAKANAERLSEALIQSERDSRANYERKLKFYKKAHLLPDKCQLSADFRRLHDEAAGMPKSASAQPVSPQAVAETVAENYTICEQNAIWLEECNKICK